MASRSRLDSPVRALAAQALSRAAGAPLVAGNRVRVLKDAAEHFPAMLAAIESAERSIFLEMYIISDDETSRPFAEVIAAKARDGVRVRLQYDWLGTLTGAGHRFFGPLRDAGVQVRAFNPPRLDAPFGWLRRNHRKTLCVDGRVGFVTGLCLSRRWEGDPERGIDPWRDTGVEIHGPALVDLEEAFAGTWAEAGPPLAAEDFTEPSALEPAGDVPLRVVASQPAFAGLYRLDQLVGSLAQKTLWLADAYFVGVPPYVQALRSAAQDGVDVRLLVPGASDVPVISPMSRAGYRPLLEAGVRVFEWKGSMMHAKTAVADGRWARVGSTNLNLQSWLGNWELDVAIEHDGIAREMEQCYESDLANATEIVLSRRWYGLRSATTNVARPGGRRWRAPGSSRAAAAGAMRVGRWVSAAITSRRELGPAEAALMGTIGVVFLATSAILVLFPEVLTIPIALLGAWIGIAAVLKAWALYRERRVALPEPRSSPTVEVAPAPDEPARETYPIGTES